MSMADPIDQKPDTTLPDPQALVNDALGTPTPTPTEPTPPLPTPQSLTPATPTPPVVEESVTPPPPVTPPTPVTPPPGPASNVPMGDDTPLAFAIPTPSMGATASVDSGMPSLGVIPPAPVPEAPKPKAKSKVMMVVLGIFAMLGVLGAGGYYAYQQFGAPKDVEIAAIETIARNESECKGCYQGRKLHWNPKQNNGSGACVLGDACRPVDEPNINSGETACESTGNGYVWCASTDARGVKYAFCNTSGKGCNQAAIDKGYTIPIGDFSGECICDDSTCKLTGVSAAKYAPYDNANYTDANGKTPLDKANELCAKGNGTIDFGTAKYICEVGKKGYTGGACTELNGEVFTGNQLGCFCGTVQVDTGTGHQSYTSTCGCDKDKTPPPSAKQSASPNAPTMSCTGITKTPETTPVIGTKLTFTCAGAVVPASAGTLSYKFRYMKDGGAAVALANKTTTTAELTITACGTYKVQCQACATLNGVLTCDPLWVGATQ